MAVERSMGWELLPHNQPKPGKEHPSDGKEQPNDGKEQAEASKGLVREQPEK